MLIKDKEFNISQLIIKHVTIDKSSAQNTLKTF